MVNSPSYENYSVKPSFAHVNVVTADLPLVHNPVTTCIITEPRNLDLDSHSHKKRAINEPIHTSERV